MNVALIKNNTVENIIVVDTIEWAQEHLPQYDQMFDISVTPVSIGWIYKDGQWIDPTPAPVPMLKSILTPLEFLNRFNDAEIKVIMSLAKTDPDVELWWLRYNKAQEMDLDDPQTIQGVNMLEAAGIIAVGRAIEILTKYPV